MNKLKALYTRALWRKINGYFWGLLINSEEKRNKNVVNCCIKLYYFPRLALPLKMLGGGESNMLPIDNVSNSLLLPNGLNVSTKNTVENMFTAGPLLRSKYLGYL